MKRWILAALALIMLCMLPILSAPHEAHEAGSIHIPARGIEASIYTRKAEPIDGMSSLWHGGIVTTDADLSGVQVGDMAEIYTVEGEHLVLECISVTGIPAWLQETQGDVLVIDERWVYRFTRV